MLLGRLLLGAAAGAAATWVMGRTTSWMYAHEDPAAREREEAVRGRKVSYGVAAERIAGLFGRRLDDAARERAGNALHWGIGAGAGAVYGLIHHVGPRPEPVKALIYGAGFFLLVDELANAAFGFTPPPRAFPWQAHARGLAGHLTWGIAADAALRIVEGPATAVGVRPVQRGEA